MIFFKNFAKYFKTLLNLLKLDVARYLFVPFACLIVFVCLRLVVICRLFYETSSRNCPNK